VNAELLVKPEPLAQLIESGRCVVVDCRFDLTDEQKGRESYMAGHIPGAHYAHLGEDLAAPMTPTSGRHPLPAAEVFAGFLSRIGWSDSKLLVAHDSGNNSIAVRLWWLMRYFGQKAALLDGGLAAWTRAGLPLVSGPVQIEVAAVPKLVINTSMTVSAEDILGSLGAGTLTLVDARAPERYSGATEPLDARAGHIPGAINRPFSLNLDEFNCFKSPRQLLGEFEALLKGRPPGTVVHSCGSGVTACHNRFAMELAGMEPARIYPGSWSEWSRDESRPIETSA